MLSELKSNQVSAVVVGAIPNQAATAASFTQLLREAPHTNSGFDVSMVNA
jgi:hypothetical protein